MSPGLDLLDLAAVMEQFGVAEEQVYRDHLISHILAALSQNHRDDLIFIGGTALSRTYLTAGRLSEDIDLIARSRRTELARAITDCISRAVLRTHGRSTWEPPDWSERSNADTAVLSIGSTVAIRLQLLEQDGYQPWPIELRPIEQRYADSPPATLWVPTLPSFAAWKTDTWFHRHTARDLYDLWGLANIGAVNPEAAELFRLYGSTGDVPDGSMFNRPPSDDEWTAQLSAQTRLMVGPREALDVVRSHWATVARFV